MKLQDVTFADVDTDQSGSVTMDEFINCMMGKINELEITAHGMQFIEDEDNMDSVKPKLLKGESITKPNNISEGEEDEDEYMVDLKKKEQYTFNDLDDLRDHTHIRQDFILDFDECV